MTDVDLKIPDEFKDQLSYVEAPDTRSDEEILSILNRYVRVTSEKNIWAFWHSGIEQMPAWCQRNVIDWVRINGPSWTVRVLDNVPDSPNYVLKHLPAETLPKSFIERTMDGPYVGPHSADFLRGATLTVHGGVFMDVGNILLRSIDRICWRELEDPSSPFNGAIPWMYGTTIAQHLIAARKGDPFIQRW
jgi:mannosyltransferase OCH1-like enzyme